MQKALMQKALMQEALMQEALMQEARPNHGAGFLSSGGDSLVGDASDARIRTLRIHLMSP